MASKIAKAVPLSKKQVTAQVNAIGKPPQKTSGASSGKTVADAKKSAIRGGSKTATKKPVAAAPVATPASASPTAPQIPTLEDYLNSDGTYIDTLAALNRSDSDNDADVAKQKRDYQTTYDDDLRQLGYQAGGGWNMNDARTTSGRLFSNQANDFAARGMLQSSGYADALQNTSRSLTDQVTDATTAKQKYDSDLDAYGSAQRSSNDDARTRAKREAIARRASTYATAASGVLS